MSFYKFNRGDCGYVFALDTYYPCEIYANYFSDKYNHPAKPHKRCVVKYKSGRLDDVSECEVSNKEEYENYCKQFGYSTKDI